jgi:hypothetical protein
MHYVPGHEVAAHITKEVTHLALSTTIPWNTVKENESYYCQVGDIVATKIVMQFNCTPDVVSIFLIPKLKALIKSSYLIVLNKK